MPDNKGQLTGEEGKAATEWLNAKIKGAGSCGVCKKGTLSLKGLVGHLLNAQGTGGYPVLVAICDRCGFVQLHGAMKAGIVKDATGEDTEK